MSDRFQFVLCQTQCSANIGSVARALSVMNFSQLTLSSPHCEIDEQSYRLACHGQSVLELTTVKTELSQCLSPSHFVIGFSNRSRTKGPVFYPFKTGLDKAKKEILSSRPISFVFGSENFGLSNEELSFCDQVWEIPTYNPQYSSLNLAQAVQVVSYEIANLLAEHGHCATIGKKTNHGSTAYIDTDDDLINFKGLDNITSSIVNTPVFESFMSRTTSDHTRNHLINIFKTGIKDESDLKFIMGFLKVFYKSCKDKEENL